MTSTEQLLRLQLLRLLLLLLLLTLSPIGTASPAAEIKPLVADQELHLEPQQQHAAAAAARQRQRPAAEQRQQPAQRQRSSEAAARGGLQSGCNFFGKAGHDYADANIAVIQLNSTAKPLSSCCAACDAWNDRKPAARCSIGVVLHQRGMRTDVCMLKASVAQPFPNVHATAVQPAAKGPGGMANLDLIVLPPSVADRYGAKCLDGSPPALYFKAANTSADPSAANKWVLFFKGGGW